MRLSTPVKTYLSLSFPFLLWCWLYRGFFIGKSHINEDTFAIYAVVKYFLVNIRMGVFPHWNPFIHWGMGDVCQIGEFNPLWLVTLLLTTAGVDVYHAFVATIALYFGAGALGVYCLIRRLFRDQFLAYLGYVLFMFSSIGMTVFTQVTMVFIFVPSIWFLYFLTVFYQDRRPWAILAMGYALMIILTTYIPFYFLIMFGCLAVLGAVVYGRVCLEILGQVAAVATRYPHVLICACAGVAVACAEGFFNWTFLKTDFTSLARPALMNYTAVQNSGIPIEEISRDTSLFHFLIALLQVPILPFLRDIFSLHNIPADDQRIFYVSVLTHGMIFAACLARLNKRAFFWGAYSFILFLIALAGLTPVYAFLFKHVPFFDTFRNIFFLIPFILLAYILLALEFWRSFWGGPGRQHYGHALISGVILALYWLFWFKAGYLPVSSTAVIGGFMLLLIARFSGYLAKDSIWAKAALIVLAVAGPVEVMHRHAAAFSATPSPIIASAVKAPLGNFKFVFTRPPELVIPATEPLDMYHLYNWYFIMMQDEPGNKFPYGYTARWAQELSEAAPSIPGFDGYARHKFVAYDHFDTGATFTDARHFGEWFPHQRGAQAFNAAGQGVEVVRFNANQVHLKTNFTSRKFLVYNDSYHPQWKVYVGGRREELFRANYAFKGVWVPAGAQDVRFEFEPVGGRPFVMAVLMMFYAYFLWIVCLFIRRG